MLPSVVIQQVQDSLLDYLATTLKLRDAELEAALRRFLLEPEEGIFRGPYLDVRLPFRKVEEAIEVPLDVLPQRRPYAHQMRAFERLTSRDGHAPEATLVTTGTGSGKTECFLYPLLDHCRRERQRGRAGIKAILLYPMNALATDQAERFARELQRPELRGVSAGLYVGGKGQHGVPDATHLVDQRDILRKSPPDILLTNYKMLDLLLLRPEDRSLWGENGPATLRYLVLDELHTYDGAQGSDVACLLRRLKDRLGTPSGHLCCVGTSATIGTSGGASGVGASGADPRAALLEFASKVFGEAFDAAAIVGEDRLSVREAFPGDAEKFEDPIEWSGDAAADPLEPRAYADRDAYLAAQAPLWDLGAPRHRVVMGSDLGNHPFLRALLHALRGRDGTLGPRHWLEVADQLGRADPAFAAQSRERQWLLLSSFLSLVAHARREVDGKEEPFLTVQLQLWVRELRGLVRKVEKQGAHLAWRDELKVEAGEHWLPIVYCRDCGHVGAGAIQREGEQKLGDTPGEIGRAFLERRREARFVALGSVPTDGSIPEYLCPRCLSVREGMKECDCTPEKTACIPVELSRKLTEEKRFRDDCPRCGAENALTMLGSRAATLSSVAVSQLFLSRFNRDQKLLAFTDSVQDASHRAGFFAARTYRFTLRTAIQSTLEAASGDVPLPELPERLLAYWSQKLGPDRAIASLMAPDLREEPDYAAFSDAEKRTKSVVEPAAALLKRRLGWEVTQEFGLGVVVGRSLDSTCCSTLAVDEGRLEHAAARLLAYLNEEHPVARRPFEASEVRHFLEGMVQRLRLRGGIYNALLRKYVQKGSRYFLRKLCEPALPRFGPRSRVPLMLYEGNDHDVFDALFSRPQQYTWHRDWTARCLEVAVQDIGIDAVLARALTELTETGIAGRYKSGKGYAAGLAEDALRGTANVQRVACKECGHGLTLHREAAARFVRQRCLGYRCSGSYQEATYGTREASYYQRLYKGDRIVRIFASEHTGLLERHVREEVERSFKDQKRPDAPNLLTCTPTLEMGIDIGDLSAVMLCSVPPLASNYLQRVGRAGRKTGNSAVLTMVRSHPHDLYFSREPTEMLRGEVSPPGCFLDAPEILVRQLLAHAMDQWARTGTAGRIEPRIELIPRKPQPDRFPYSFYEYYGREAAALTDRFLTLFAAELTPPSVTRLREAAADGALLGPMREAFASIQTERQELRDRIAALNAREQAISADPTLAEPNDSEPDTPEERLEAELAELRDARGAYRRIQDELDGKHPLNVLTDAGILPNYAFPEPGVTLKTLLRGPKHEGGKADGTGGEGPRVTRRFEYLRPASSAIREFAPFNTFYAEGHKLKVSQIDVGSRARPLLVEWRLCPQCHHAERVIEAEPASTGCPKCNAPQFLDQGQKRWMVHFRQAWSAMDLMEASTADDTEDREGESYSMVELIDVRPEHQRGGWLVQNDKLVFGYELLSKLRLRELNLGVRGDRGEPLELAGEKVDPKGFVVCRDCGKVQPRRFPRQGPVKTEHAPYCRSRTAKQPKEELETVFLYRELVSEAIRVLLPVSDYGVERVLPTVSAALSLGFRRKFRGQAAHLRITTATEALGGVRRRYLVIFDTVPGGTGTLAELVRGDPRQGCGFIEVMQLALDHLRDCTCASDEHRDGCYRCLYAYQSAHQLPNLSRREAVDLLEQVLAQRSQLAPKDSLSDVPVDTVLESELERRFVEALGTHAGKVGWRWERILVQGKASFCVTLPTATWILEPQVNVGPPDVARASKPDFVARCTTRDDVLPIAIFCDGLEYHACPGQVLGRVWDDVRKRSSLVESGRYHVWSITWKDLSDAEGATRIGTPSLLVGSNSAGFRQATQRLEKGREGYRVPTDLADLNGFEQLVRFLAAPDRGAWGDATAAAGVGCLDLRQPFTDAAVATLRQQLRGEPARHPEAPARQATPGAVMAGLEVRTASALLVELPTAAMKKSRFEELRFTLRVFDDADGRSDADFEASWRALLQSWNLLQFHAGEVVVTSTELLGQEADTEPELALAQAAVDARRESQRPLSEYPAAVGADANLLALGDELPEAKPLALALIERGLPAPETFQSPFGREVVLDAELAWHALRIALWYDATDADREAWAARGWQVFGLETDEPARIADAVAAAKAASER